MMSKRLAILAAVALAAGWLAAACGGGGPAPLNVTLHAQDIKFDLTSLSSKVGQTVNITLVNDGALEHSFVIDGLVEPQTAQAGQTIQFSFTANSPGSFQYYCHIAGHKEAGMVGTLTVAP